MKNSAKVGLIVLVFLAGVGFTTIIQNVGNIIPKIKDLASVPKIDDKAGNRDFSLTSSVEAGEGDYGPKPGQYIHNYGRYKDPNPLSGRIFSKYVDQYNAYERKTISGEVVDIDVDIIPLAGGVNPGLPIEYIWIKNSNGNILQILSPYSTGLMPKTGNHEASYVVNFEYIPLKRIDIETFYRMITKESTRAPAFLGNDVGCSDLYMDGIFTGNFLPSEEK